MAIYLIKINVALMLLYGFYRLTVSRDTFFGLRRLTLWLIYAIPVVFSLQKDVTPGKKEVK